MLQLLYPQKCAKKDNDDPLITTWINKEAKLNDPINGEKIEEKNPYAPLMYKKETFLL